MPLACAAIVFSAAAAGPELATITGRVFDVYHRPVRGAQVAPIERRVDAGKARLIAGNPKAVVDSAGMYRLSLPPGKYIVAVLPPSGELDFAAVFPSYLQDEVDFAKAQPLEVRPGEIRPFTDFLILEVESHHLQGQVTGLARTSHRAVVTLSRSNGYTEPLREVMTDTRARFAFNHVPAGSYELKAYSPASSLEGVALVPNSGKYGSIHIQLSAPEITGLQIHLRPAPR